MSDALLRERAEVPQAAIPMNLAREDYCSQDVFDDEIRKIFHRQWLVVGHVSSVRNAGDYFVKRVGPESMIISRDSKGAIRAFFNLCRHRGYKILDEGACGSAAGFVCPYHKWTYDLEGRLRRVPGSRDSQDFDFGNFPLHEARCDVFQGFIFVWLGTEEPPELGPTLRQVCDETAIAVAEPERMKLAHREVYELDANWKAMLENDMECYHCGHGGHPSLAISCDFGGFYADKRSSQHFPLRDGSKTFSMDGERVSAKALGHAADGYSSGFILWPFFSGPVFFVDHAVSLELTPLSVNKSLFISEWYVHEDAVEGVDYDRERLIEVFHTTNLEDKVFGERNYAGIQSSRFQPGPLHPRREDGIIAAYDLYRSMMAAA